MKYYQETSLYDFEAWSGGRDTLDVLQRWGKCYAVEMLIDELEPKEGWTDTGINDFLWFERDAIAEHFGFSDLDEMQKELDGDENGEEV